MAFQCDRICGHLLLDGYVAKSSRVSGCHASGTNTNIDMAFTAIFRNSKNIQLEDCSPKSWKGLKYSVFQLELMCLAGFKDDSRSMMLKRIMKMSRVSI